MTTTAAVPLSAHLREHVASRATRLQKEYRENVSSAVADLAMLRRGVAQHPGQDARLIPLTIAGLHKNPQGLLDDIPTDAEYAAFAALTLFALHQQSHRTASMHRNGYSFGRSARLLGKRSNAQDAVRRRFTAVGTASSWEETLHHTRGLIQQFRAHDIPLDYGRFAVDLMRLRSLRTADGVRLAWGRDFYRTNVDDDTEPDADDDTDRDGDVASND
ncbi:type I-E CRISPR-associated protein Cse2/CasB [Microbacterium sp. ARD32]|uniref:type I-E CRISPR-associated protein Cse2/CasB n=1 Tax=Microbacterium sp. ARD32 TaxID=2962577 RepID=UPI002881CAFB|nr:type I-E CRISPR-associated protein Cse2/CasB [Microbacterium sp. ARD32]MDT0157644.1 type I-E CRISPR-associated protein Cse2/CasB [Microbacterium sp. ARD32]